MLPWVILYVSPFCSRSNLLQSENFIENRLIFWHSVYSRQRPIHSNNMDWNPWGRSFYVFLSIVNDYLIRALRWDSFEKMSVFFNLPWVALKGGLWVHFVLSTWGVWNFFLGVLMWICYGVYSFGLPSLI